MNQTARKPARYINIKPEMSRKSNRGPRTPPIICPVASETSHNESWNAAPVTVQLLQIQYS